MPDKICPICKNKSEYRLSKGEIDYYQCTFCKTLYCDALDNSNMVGGEFEEGRHDKHKEERIERILSLMGRYGKMLDFGAGNGLMLNDCKEFGINCEGYDKYNPKFNVIKSDKYNLITMVEVIEHLTEPYDEINLIFDRLADNGIVYIETSFVDVAEEENIPLEEFFYIAPQNGHSTIFSHKGLDILMQSKGFVSLPHMNRNVRLYQKKKKMVTLITPTQGNPIALKRTIDSLAGVINEVIVGSVCIFEKDEELIQSYDREVNLKLIKMPFNYIFCNGFSNTLNLLASYATNDWVIYLNVGEVVEEGKSQILDRLNDDYHCFYLDHATETHHWFRFYNRNFIHWGGMIHEEIYPFSKPCTDKPIFRFADTSKDMDDEYYAKCLDSVKECVYFNQYLKLVDQPHLIDNTNHGWVDFAKEGYVGFIERLHKKGDLYEAFLTGNKELLMQYLKSEEFASQEELKSSKYIEFQSDPMFLGK